jgi:hypothetical protein
MFLSVEWKVADDVSVGNYVLDVPHSRAFAGDLNIQPHRCKILGFTHLVFLYVPSLDETAQTES